MAGASWSRRCISLLMPLVLGAASAVAAPAPCFTAEEVEAAEAIRFHTDLMVASLVCRPLRGDHDSYDRYRAFTRKHEGLFAAYERTLINRFARLESGGDPVRRFDTYRTELANALSDRAATTPLPSLCAGHAAVMDAWEPLDSNVLGTYLLRRRHMEIGRYAVCTGNLQR